MPCIARSRGGLGVAQRVGSYVDWITPPLAEHGTGRVLAVRRVIGGFDIAISSSCLSCSTQLDVLRADRESGIFILNARRTAEDQHFIAGGVLGGISPG